MNTKIWKPSDKLKDTYGITVVTNNPQFSEPPDPIVKCTNCSRRPIKNCTQVYQMQFRTVRSYFIIVRRNFVFIRGIRSSDPIDYLLCNQCELYLSDKYNDKENGPQFIWPDFYWSILRYEDICKYDSYEFIWKIVHLEWRRCWFYDIVFQFLTYYNSISII